MPTSSAQYLPSLWRGSKELTSESRAADYPTGKTNRPQTTREQDGKKVHLRLWSNDNFDQSSIG